jgi:flavodoxin I
LIVGSPTQGFRPTKAISGFLESVPKDALKNIKVAAFDTRMDVNDIKPAAARAMVKLGGYAAKHIEAAMKKAGGIPIMPPEGFFVKDREGPLKDGELERAAAWGKQIMEMVGAK